MKISYIHGPGDAFGTFLQWKQNRADGGIIKQTYSSQFYDIISEIDGRGQIICTTPTEASLDIRFKFETISRKRASGIKYYLQELKYAFAISKKVGLFEPDIIIVSSDFPRYFFDILPSRPLKILSIHNTFWRPYGYPHGFKEWLLNRAEKFGLRNTNLAVCVSMECKRQFEAIRSPSSVFSIMQIPRLKENSSTNNDRNPENILFVGRIEFDKGVEDLIHAFSIVKREFPYLRLKIVGSGGALEKLKVLAVQLGLQAEIDFAGPLDALGVGKSYAEADLCICPTQWSFNEGLATVPLEAGSYGVPTIMSEAVPAKEQFGDGSIVFEPGNVKDLSNKIRHIISDKEAFKIASKDARESFSRTMREVGDWKSGIYACIEHANN